MTKVVTGYLSASSWGWPASFYLLGGIGLVWCGCWGVFSTDTPATHPYIGVEERNYIEQALNQEKDHMVVLVMFRRNLVTLIGSYRKNLPYHGRQFLNPCLFGLL